MKINLNQFLIALTKALDFAESELIGTAPFHSIRVALITSRLMIYSGHTREQSYAAATAALLHDCALAEYLTDEADTNHRSHFERDMQNHCIAGEKIGERLPFYSCVQNAILYHHECADGSGAFGRLPQDTPDYAQYIHLADMADVHANLYSYSNEKADELRQFISDCRGTAFSSQCVDLFNSAIDNTFLESISGNVSAEFLCDISISDEIDISINLLQEMSMIFADITDYKSHFTWHHSIGIAEKAFKIGEHLALPQEECRKLFIAGLLHDIGKLLISNTILEKPGKLDADEYREIQNHAIGTWILLKDITGLEDICSWASRHHEKLDGSGYPFCCRAEDLSRNDRLLACLDIYQALTETRPYKAGMSHAESMSILYKMGDSGQLDPDLLNEIGLCFASEQ